MTVRDFVAQRLRSIRIARGLSQGQVARAAGVEQREISLYEKGRSFPELERLRDIAEALGVTLADLFQERLTRSSDVDAVTRFVARANAHNPKFARRLLQILRLALSQ